MITKENCFLALAVVMVLFNAGIICVWLPSDAYIPLKPGQYLIEGADAAAVTVKLKSDLFAPIDYGYVALINIFFIGGMIVLVSAMKKRKGQ